MNSTDPSAKPTTIASVSPLNKVMPNVASSTAASPRDARSNVAEGVALEHVPAHDRKHRGEDGERDVAGERRRDQNEEEQEQRMRHAGDGTARPCPHVRRGSGYGPGHANAAEQARRDIGDALTDQFAVRTMAPAGHAVGDDGGEQRFDRAEQRERDRVRQHGLHLLPG